MIIPLYSIRDEVSAFYSAPFTSTNNASAIRSFSDSCKDSSTAFHSHPDDYSLYRIGEFNTDIATLIPLDDSAAIRLVGACEFVPIVSNET